MEYPIEYKIRSITVDEDSVDIRYRYDEMCGVWLGDYPYFVEEPRRTPNGRPWMNMHHTDCSYARVQGISCSKCEHFRREKTNDRIGVCFLEENRRKVGMA